MAAPNDSTIDLSALAGALPRADEAIDQVVLDLFDRCGAALFRYVSSFGLSVEETEDVVQDVFLALFRHLHLGRPRTNLNGWLFRVAHNLALRQRRRTRSRLASTACDDSTIDHVDPSPNPERQLAHAQSRRRLQSIVSALPDKDRHCIFLRAEGLRYREIATVLGMSLGGVAKSLARSIAKLMKASDV